jgi:hypothetical protein
MRLANDAEPLDGRVEMDDAYLGGKRSGGKTGRGSPGKRPIVVAVQSSDGKPARLKVRRIARFKRKRVKSLAKRIVAPGALVVTDGLSCFKGVADAGCTHHPIATSRSRQGASERFLLPYTEADILTRCLPERFTDRGAFRHAALAWRRWCRTARSQAAAWVG